MKSQRFWKLLETDHMLGVTLGNFIWKPFGIMPQLIYVSKFYNLCLVLIHFVFCWVVFFQKFEGIVLFKSHGNILN